MTALRAAASTALLAAVWLPAALPAAAAAGAEMASYSIVNDAIPLALGGLTGDPARGHALVANRQASMCLLCHQAPLAEEKFQGDISTNLAGAGARWSAAQLRLRLVDARRQNPATVMPAYYRLNDQRANESARVAPAWRDKPLLDAQQIEDIVAWLQSLR